MKQIIPRAGETIDARRHLAIDEAALSLGSESIRIWEFDNYTAVLGRSSRVADEIHQDFCQQNDIEILRRCSGGASILGGPGCLMYSVVLSLARRPELAKIDAAHSLVMKTIAAAAAAQIPDIRVQGICDLTWQGKKCGGNALRVTREAVLYHGTILYAFDLPMLQRCLNHAPRQPQYRGGRSHQDFVTNLDLNPKRLADDIVSQFDSSDTIDTGVLQPAVETLMTRRYDDAAWHLRH